jgi:hypothetical protein
MKRLVLETEDAFERALLRSARRDVPPEHGAHEAALALAAAAAKLPTIVSSGSEGFASSSSQEVAGALAEHAAAAKGSALALWKWMGIGVIQIQYRERRADARLRRASGRILGGARTESLVVFTPAWLCSARHSLASQTLGNRAPQRRRTRGPGSDA